MTTSLLTARNLSVGATTRIGSFPVISDLNFDLQPGKVLGPRRRIRCWKVHDRAYHRPVPPIRILRQQR